MKAQSKWIFSGRPVFTLASLTVLNAIAAGAAAAPPRADTESTATLEEVVVTAQKREERISRVPMSITALSADTLAERNITTSEDLMRVVPGFQFAISPTGVPVYSIRGIGFNDTSTAARPTVSVYLDQVPLPFSIETKGASMDLERVEVLKGPQGTLFGGNSTGGGINYIAAKPTESFELGADLSYGRFNAVQFDGFISGPLAPEVTARLAVRHSGGDAWQDSQTSSDELGKKDFTAVRFLTDWKPTDALNVEVNLNAWWDKSDSQAPQFLAFRPTSPAFANRIPDIYKVMPEDHDNRAADWTPGVDYGRDDKLYQGSLRVDYELGQNFQLTSLTSYIDFESEYVQDPDGSQFPFFQFGPKSALETFFQELRLSGSLTDRIRIIAGVNYQSDDIVLDLDEQIFSTASYGFTPLGLPQFTHVTVPESQQVDSYAGFTNFDFQLTGALTLHAGVRYTDSKSDFKACTADGGDGAFSTGFSAVINRTRARAGLPPTSFAPGECGTLIAQTLRPGVATDTLEETNTSWRGGLDWQLNEETMLYANVSRGYKSGSFPLLGATNSLQYEPATQESVIAYESGVKTTLADQLQLTGAVFYYDYRDKQIFGVFIDPTFGPLKREVNVPKAEETGAEVQITWRPISGLTVSGGATWLDSKFKSDFRTPTIFNTTTNLKDDPFPFTPKWQGNLDVEYGWSLENGWRPFVGVSGYAQSDTNAELGALAETEIDSYTLLDMRAGVRSADDQWTVSLWGKNLTDEYYWNNATLYHDTVVRFTGMPRMYGLRFSYSLK